MRHLVTRLSGALGSRIVRVGLCATAFAGQVSAAKLGLWSAPPQAMTRELAEHRILVNALTPGSIITEERIAKLKDGTVSASDAPEGAIKTREKLQAAVKRGGFAQMLTTLMPLGLPGDPDETARAVLVLASDMASYINGANLIVDGGADTGGHATKRRCGGRRPAHGSGHFARTARSCNELITEHQIGLAWHGHRHDPRVRPQAVESSA